MRLQLTVAAERHRIQSVVHDRALPLLAGAIYQLNIAERLLDPSHVGWLAMHQGRRLMDAAISAIRGALAGTGTPPTAAASPIHPASISPLKVTIAGIVAEAIANAVAHGKARTIRADVQQNDREVIIRVWDDGQGFNVAEATRQAWARQRLGLGLLRERARLAGGRLTITSHPSGGTVILAHLPRDGGNGRG